MESSGVILLSQEASLNTRWAQLGSNQWLPPCKGGALPLSYRPARGILPSHGKSMKVVLVPGLVERAAAKGWLSVSQGAAAARMRYGALAPEN